MGLRCVDDKRRSPGIQISDESIKMLDCSILKRCFRYQRFSNESVTFSIYRLYIFAARHALPFVNKPDLRHRHFSHLLHSSHMPLHWCLSRYLHVSMTFSARSSFMMPSTRVRFANASSLSVIISLQLLHARQIFTRRRRDFNRLVYMISTSGKQWRLHIIE